MGLEAKKLSFSFTQSGQNILENVSFQIKETERIGMFAPSGYGKTTLARLLAGHLQPQKGQILLDGKPLPKRGCCPVQLVGQHPEQSVNPRWRMEKVLQEAGQLREEVLTGLGIEESWLSRFPAELSGGELQRFCIARALCAGTRYLLADEVSTMLDAVTQAQIWQYILAQAKARGIALLVISHSRPLLEKVAVQVIKQTNRCFDSCT